MNEYQNKDDVNELPLLVSDMGDGGNTRVSEKRGGRRALVVGIVFCMLVTAISLCAVFMNATPKALQNVETDVPETLESEEWRGAFFAKNIYDECYESAVTLRLGRDNESACWSGFVIDPDGWIVTTLDMMDSSKRGRIYVAFNDGSEYSVESIWKDSESGIALVKIPADGLNAVDLRGDGMHGGERVICVSALEYGTGCVSSGEISGTLDDGFKVNVGLDASGVGAPLFDESGCLVAMATARDMASSGKISYAVSANRCKNVFDCIKNEKNQ